MGGCVGECMRKRRVCVLCVCVVSTSPVDVWWCGGRAVCQGWLLQNFAMHGGRYCLDAGNIRSRPGHRITPQL